MAQPLRRSTSYPRLTVCFDGPKGGPTFGGDQLGGFPDFSHQLVLREDLLTSRFSWPPGRK